MTTETLDKLYLEWSQFTSARTRRELELNSLLRRAQTQLLQWADKYGNWNPSWLPPSGDIRLLEDIDDALRPPVEKP